MKELATEADLILACKDMAARERNAGNWINGIPDSFYLIRHAYNLPLDRACSWVLTVEAIVNKFAVRKISEILD